MYQNLEEIMQKDRKIARQISSPIKPVRTVYPEWVRGALQDLADRLPGISGSDTSLWNGAHLNPEPGR
jgi:hypothetical protein